MPHPVETAHLGLDSPHRKQQEVAELLLEKGASYQVKNENGQRPYELAKAEKRKNVASLLKAKEKVCYDVVFARDVRSA